MNPNRNIKPESEIRLGGQVKKMQQVKVKVKGICLDEKIKTKPQTSQTLQLEDMNQKILVKMEDLKDTETWSSHRNKTGHSKITKESSTYK